MTASMTRTYLFSASHRLHTPALPEAENARIFGKCNNPYGHGHNYELQVTVRGPVDVETGLVVNRDRLDGYVRKQVVHRFEHKNINLDVPELRELVPTTENMVLAIAGLLEEHWDSTFGMPGPVLTRLHIQETGRNGFEVLIPNHSDKLFGSARTGAVALSS
jgi:6-pyruvoyltetrahydropterin/6-carboxytetrahydropterin synthase